MNFNTLSEDIIAEFIIPYLSYRTIICLMRTNKSLHKLLQKFLIKLLRECLSDKLPIEVYDYAYLTGGMLLSELTDGLFATRNIDLVANTPSAAVALSDLLIDEYDFEFIRLQSTGMDPDKLYIGMIKLTRVPKKEEFESDEEFTKRLSCECMHLTINVPSRIEESDTYWKPNEAIEEHDLSVSKLWFNGKELFVDNAIETLNLDNLGFVCRFNRIRPVFIDSEDEGVYNISIDHEDEFRERIDKYMERGYLMGYYETRNKRPS